MNTEVARILEHHAPKPAAELLLVNSLLEAMEEHGVPNKFHASELTRPGLRMEKVKRLGQKLKGTEMMSGCAVRYLRGYFYVGSKETR